MTENEFLEALDKIIQGSNFKELTEQYPYKVPYLSTKIREVAKKYGKENLLNDALKQQKILRNNGICTGLPEIYKQQATSKTNTWKKHPTLPVEVSDGGLVKSIKYNNILRAAIKAVNTNNYAQVIINENGTRTSKQVHRLVLETYKPVSNSDQLQCDHLDNCGLNNQLSNLEWVTAQENIQRSFIRNNTVKKHICSNGGIKGSKTLQEKALLKYGGSINGFISFHPGKEIIKDACITYKCQCGSVRTASIMWKEVRKYKGICPNCTNTLNRSSNSLR
jgi:hypothetical protein